MNLDAIDRKKIQYLIESTLYELHDENLDADLNLDIILKNWKENKDVLYQLLGNNFILSKEITYERPMGDFIEFCDNNIEFHRRLYNLILQKITGCNNYKLWYLPEEEPVEPYRTSTILFQLFKASSLWNNKINEEYKFKISINNNIVKVDSHCKLTRAIKKICDLLDLEKECDEWLLEYSRQVNDKIVKGKFCLSIHPLDYMTMSDNYCDWDSCMSWRDNGSYKQGTVEMMNSQYVIIAYIESHRPYFLDDDELTWSNKKWRELFIVSPQIIQGIKGYPYENAEIEKIFASWIKELAKKNLGWTYENEYKTYKLNGHKCFEFNKDIGFFTNYMYNDFKVKKYNCYINNYEQEDIHIKYSGESQCMICGGSNIKNSADLFCDCCLGITRCPNCGSEFDESDLIIVNGEYYCSDCYDDNFTACDCCNSTDIPIEDIYRIEIRTSSRSCSFGDICSKCFEKKLKDIPYIQRGSRYIYNLENLNLDTINNITFFYLPEKFQSIEEVKNYIDSFGVRW